MANDTLSPYPQGFFEGFPHFSPQLLTDIHKQFTIYHRLLIEWNSKFNMISQGDLKNIPYRHVYDSLMLLKCYPNALQNGNRLVDIGSGAGFPGLVLALAVPGLHADLLESNQKKVSFLLAAKEELGLARVNIFAERAEEFGQDPTFREQYDAATARAVAHPPTVLELLLPLVKLGGSAYFWGSGAGWAETGQLKKISEILGAQVIGQSEYVLPGDSNPLPRQILRIERTSPCPPKYPRRTGVPGKLPLRP
jgi:16S rRNA (guanine527-N7)-methyltransferase